MHCRMGCCSVCWESRCLSTRKVAHIGLILFPGAKAYPLGGAWCTMVFSPALCWASQIGLPREMLLLTVYCPLSRHSTWINILAKKWELLI